MERSNGDNYRKADRFHGINIMTIKGVTVVGSENVVNKEYSDLYEVLSEPKDIIGETERRLFAA
ncbi:hypothetical protein HKBW3S06_00113 [Candidatus Hakubella thermalkaliphila]|uniref:Uncharacterized protein n=1 Tax=Candidatus Hakubella thermalkaliphila TaxID=2754717 RepID=A0A6V8NR55_9ACTN|nr:hypothetical protein [Candidatus Hakubella thermalkaliphila]GFP20886.1 hypothetical protein HKBW3S06_00113 [Candidatus Hakubella thermalkaliphila]GFP36977.1 hypothetical protein HKBW3S44_00658 [Candidatus Hakubella thermalkaliphila]GFP41163.1 hypothetical protein HKBW3C_00289 [Candidatus Hakubella thermalkaliphila]